MEQEEPKPEPVKLRSCVLEASDAGVRFIVDGELAQVVAFDTYETLHKGLTHAVEFNIYPLETAGHVQLKLQLPPLAEIRAGRVALQSQDGVVYGRYYKIAGMQKDEDGTTHVDIALADTGAVVERQEWEEFKKRVEFNRCRGGTAYRTMLGEFNARLYFDVTKKLYKPPEKHAAESADGEKKSIPPEAPKGAEKAEAGETSWLEDRVGAFRTWLQANPRYAYRGAVIAALILILGIALSLRSCRPTPAGEPVLDTSSARSVDSFLEKNYQDACRLSAMDFARYAAQHPQAAKDALDKLDDFVNRTRSKEFTPEQDKKRSFIRDALPNLRAELAKAKAK